MLFLRTDPVYSFFFFNDTATTEIYTLSLHDALPISVGTTGNLTLNLTGGVAPAGGLTVNLSSSDTSKATVPATVTFAANATSVAVPVSSEAEGSATHTATETGFALLTATENVASLVI